MIIFMYKFDQIYVQYCKWQTQVSMSFFVTLFAQIQQINHFLDEEEEEEEEEECINSDTVQF